ncbi:MAG TPA: TonB family protein [Candidatus Binatia bacterium]|jgi:protein TonB
MNDRWLISSFTASSLIHLGLIPIAALIMHVKAIKPVTVPIELVEMPRIEEPKKLEVPPPPPPPKPKNITAPKLLSKPTLETKSLPPPASTKEEIKEKAAEPPPPPLPADKGSPDAGWNLGSKASEAEGSAAGAGNLFGKGDTAVVGGSGVEGGGGGSGNAGLGRGAKGDGTGGSSDALSSTARPLGGYQVKPRYPESARRAGVQGVTTLRVRVLDNGRVGDVVVEQSAGFHDLDSAAVDAVKKWLFEPARRGKEAVSVWVLLPVKFELH